MSVRKSPPLTDPLPIDAAWRRHNRAVMQAKNLSLNALHRLVGCSLSHLASVMSDEEAKTETPYRTAIERALDRAPIRKGRRISGGRPRKRAAELAAVVVAATPPVAPAPDPASTSAPAPGPTPVHEVAPPVAPERRYDEIRRLLPAMIPLFSDKTLARVMAAIEGDLDS